MSSQKLSPSRPVRRSGASSAGSRAGLLRARPVSALLGMLVIVLALAGCTTSGSSKNSQTGSGTGFVGGDSQYTRVPIKKREKAPVISGPSVADTQKTISSADYSGKVLVINVWGSWCGPCRSEAPALQEASVKTKAKAQFIGIDSRDTGSAAPAAFQRAHKITYPSIFDPDGSQVVKFKTLPPSAIPSTLVIDKHGRIAVRILGSISKDTMIDIIDDIAAGK